MLKIIAMNPFLINNYIGPEYFCDRNTETETLLKNVYNQSNTTMFSQRRMGKTALIKHLFFYLEKEQKVTPLYLDIFSTSNLKGFSDALSTAIYTMFPIQKSIGQKFWEHIKLLRPVMKINELSGSPELSLDISKPEQIEKSIPQLLSFLDNQKKRVVIAIDEFQQILTYPEKNVEALLRTAIQNLTNVHFIFFGSNRKLMTEIFNNSKRPFYASTKFLNLEKIPEDDYLNFIQKSFENHNFTLGENVPRLILETTKRHTYYTQQLCHEIFSGRTKKITEKVVMQTLFRILSQNEPIYYQYRNLLTKPQWNLLRAVARETRVERPYVQDFLRKHALGSTSTVKRGLQSLVEKDFIYHNIFVETPYYELQDKFLMLWLQNN